MLAILLLTTLWHAVDWNQNHLKHTSCEICIKQQSDVYTQHRNDIVSFNINFLKMCLWYTLCITNRMFTIKMQFVLFQECLCKWICCCYSSCRASPLAHVVQTTCTHPHPQWILFLFFHRNPVSGDSTSSPPPLHTHNTHTYCHLERGKKEYALQKHRIKHFSLSVCLTLAQTALLAFALRVPDMGFNSRLRWEFFWVKSYQWLNNWYSSGYPARHLAL